MASEIEITNAFEEIASPSASEIEITNTCKKIVPPSTCENEITNPIKEIGPSSTSEIEITNDSEEIALPSASNIEIINAFEEMAMPSASEIEKLNAFEKIAVPSASNIEISSAFEEIAPPSASNSATSSTPLQKLPWDVFINHRGPDVKHTLAIRIYNVLHGMGLRVFLDSEELQLGDFLPTTLEETMRNASLHLAIFSPGYAYSPWCLAELSFMFKTGAPIIPVFYHVQPTDLQLLAEGKGIYANDFLQHQEKGRYSLKKLEEWKKILYNVSFYEGENINNNE